MSLGFGLSFLIPTQNQPVQTHASEFNQPPEEKFSTDVKLIWPLLGPISSPYGPSHPLGIDIDGDHYKVGDPIVASTPGEVIFAGGNRCCSYGLFVVVMQQTAPELSDGFFLFTPGVETLYAHMDSLAVKQGDKVTQGQRIGGLGSTGYSTGPHLHFEVIVDGTRENPTDYLPKSP